VSRPYAEVIGDPIAQSKSPLIHNFWLAKLGIDAEYRACHVRAEELADYFAQRRGDPVWRGCNVTIPHKVSVVSLADESGFAVTNIGASNCVVPREGKLVADNTDIAGVDKSVIWVGSPTCIIGAGGAARAVLPTLDAYVACYPLHVIARDTVKAVDALNAENLDIKIFGFDNAAEAMRHATGIINASPLGMVGQPAMPATVLEALGQTRPGAPVFDMVYAPLETELLKTARNLGRETVDGLVMLIAQAAAAFELFFGQPAPREHDAELRALLTK
jgi:shikimate dehydrogenase